MFTDLLRNHVNEKYFSNSTSEIHLKTHSEDTPFQCEVCGKSFSESCNFKGHIRTHTGETPYYC